jgi:hypothetical protein
MNATANTPGNAISTELPAAAPEERLAAGVLDQAARDLRRFRNASNGVERELYLDAYRWITANDFSWPYSFVNVCKSLHSAPETVRVELLSEFRLSGLGHWMRLREGVSNLLRASLTAFSGHVTQTENP